MCPQTSNKIIYLCADTLKNMERELYVPYLSFDQPNSSDLVSSLLDENIRNNIDNIPWFNDADVKAAFSIAHTDEAVFLKFFVIEEHISARYNQPNDSVYKDSCVEFFMAFPGEAEYYNFEFNCKGNCHVGFGSKKEDRELIKLPLIDNIKTTSTFKTEYLEGKAMINWELTIAIPFASFWHHDIKSLKNQKAKVNFYKCGDELPQPHYLCWSPIQSSEPNFHLPEFFGEAIFEN